VTRPPDSAAHHIVAHGDRRAADSRAILNNFGIDINDASNGVFLPSNVKSVNPSNAAVHSRVHTDAYHRAVTQRLVAATQKEDAIGILKQIGQDLLKGSFQ
jgi:hypothetical protein